MIGRDLDQTIQRPTRTRTASAELAFGLVMPSSRAQETLLPLALE